MARSISELFMNRFMDKNDLYPVLEYVKADNSLDLEMRGNYVSIYYRGGSVLRIFEDKGHYGSIDPRYINSHWKTFMPILPKQSTLWISTPPM